MRCDRCGGETGTDVTFDTRSEGFRGSQAVPYTLCRSCANSRRSIQMMWFRTAGALIGAGILAAVLHAFVW